MQHVDQKIKNRALHRAKILEGQLKALLKAIENEEYCTRLLNQSRSIQRSLKSLDQLLLENHLKSHIKHEMHNGNADKAIKELIEVYEISNK